VSVELEVRDDAPAVAATAATTIAALVRDAIRERGRCVLAVSGGHTPWLMLAELAGAPLAWERVHIAQVDERVAPEGDPGRNLTYLRAALRRAPLPAENLHPMPVDLTDLAEGARRYGAELAELAGRPPVIDVVHLGLGPDGHTASLVPGDAALEVTDAEVAVAGPYQGHERMTLTFPCLNRARHVVWVVTGAEKSGALRRLLAGDHSIPAGRVNPAHARVVADRDAAGTAAAR
jgi:6-phosphogluconolactonase